MKYEIKEHYFKNIPPIILDQFNSFINNHPLKSIKINNHEWKYIIGGQGNNTILQLPGGLRNPIYRFEFISELEKEFQFIAPIYPRICEIKPLLDGVVKIFEQEHINIVNIFGASFGGLIAQIFVHQYPNMVKKVVISNSGTTYKDKQELENVLKISRKKLKFIKIIPKYNCNKTIKEKGVL